MKFCNFPLGHIINQYGAKRSHLCALLCGSLLPSIPEILRIRFTQYLNWMSIPLYLPINIHTVKASHGQFFYGLTLALISPSPSMSKARNTMSRYLLGVARILFKKQKSVYDKSPSFWIYNCKF